MALEGEQDLERAEKNESISGGTLGQRPNLELRKLLKQESDVVARTEELEPLCPVPGDVKWCHHYGNSRVVPQKLKTELPYDLATPDHRNKANVTVKQVK